MPEVDEHTSIKSASAGNKQPHKMVNYSLRRAQISLMLVPMLYFSGLMPVSTLLPQYLVHRFTIEAGHVHDNFSTDSDPCSDDQNRTDHAEADAIQARASDISLYLSLGADVTSFFGCLLLGGFADVYGRRPMLLLALCTGLLKMSGIALTVQFDLPIWVLYLVFIADGLSGSWTVVYVPLFSAIADVCTEKKERLFWMAALNSCTSMISSAMVLLGGYFIDALGYFPASMLSVATVAASCLVTLFCLPETSILPHAKSFNVLHNVRRTVGFFALKGSTRQKLTFWTCLILFMFTLMPGMSMTTLDTLYQVHRPFCWGSFYVGLYYALRLLVQALGGISILRFAQRCVREEYIAMIGLVTQAGSYILEAFLTKSWQFAFIPVIGALGSICGAVVRGCMSVLTPSTDQAAVFSSIAVVEVVCNVMANTGVLRVYSLTVSTFPGAAYILNAAFSCTAFLLFILFMQLRQDKDEIHNRSLQFTNPVLEEEDEKQA